MVNIDKNLTTIRGIGKAIAGYLAEQGIYTVADLQRNTCTPEARELLSKKIGVSTKNLYFWAKQADLMRVKDIDAVASELIVKSGVRNVAEFAAADLRILKRLIDITFENDSVNYKKNISVDDLETWKKEASGLKNEMVNDPDDKPLELLFASAGSSRRTPADITTEARLSLQASAKEALILAEKNKAGELVLSKTIIFEKLERPVAREGGFYFGLAELIAEVGRGVAKAQHELDKSSIAIQDFIDSQETLRNYGLISTWYVLPETTFKMKVDYAVVKEETEEGEKSSASALPARLVNSLRIAPVNAKYQNYFKSTTSIESELTFKIIPVPPPTRFTEPILVPDLIGLSIEEAQERIRGSRLSVGVLELVKDAKPDNGKATQVVAQSKDAGTEVLVNDAISFAYVKEG